MEQRRKGDRREQKTGGTRLAAIACCLVVAAGLTVALAGIGTRLGLWRFPTCFGLLRWGVYLGGAALPVAIAGLWSAWRKCRGAGVLLALVAVAGSCLTSGLPLSWWLKAKRVPPIHDITTDTVNPPQFVAIMPLRRGAPNPPEYGGPEVALKQREAYPDLKSLLLGLPAEQAFVRAAETARKLGWRVVASDPREGRIEATDTTFWFGFTDDIVIRITPAGYRSLVDVRSVSRVGRSDVGTNAARIREFLSRLAMG